MHTARPSAIPPPVRPHIGLNQPFSSLGQSEWAEEDAWDSASDSESPSRTSTSWSKQPLKSAPKPVPRPTRNTSSSTLAFSYTHVQAPSPSSYPPQTMQPQSGKNGWTLVGPDIQTGDDPRDLDADDPPESVATTSTASMDDLVDQPMPIKPRQEHGSLRDNINDIVNGISSTSLFNLLSSSLRSALFHQTPASKIPSFIQKSFATTFTRRLCERTHHARAIDKNKQTS